VRQTRSKIAGLDSDDSDGMDTTESKLRTRRRNRRSVMKSYVETDKVEDVPEEEELTAATQTTAAESKSEMWEIQRITGHRTNSNGEREYEVEWKPSWVAFVTEDLKRPYDKLYPHGSGDGGGGDGNEDGDLQT
jgi:hypothetical protein